MRDSVHRGDVCLSACWDTTPLELNSPEQICPRADNPPSRHLPGADTPQSRHPLEQTPQPPGQTPPRADPSQSRHPLRADPPSRPPQSRHPPGADTPQEQTPPGRAMLGDTVNARTVRILLECNLVSRMISSLPFGSSKVSYSFFQFLCNILL